MTTWLIPPVVSLAAVVVLTPLVMRLARARGWVAHPTEDRWHRTPTALMGGIGIFVGTSTGWAVLGPEGPLVWIWLGGGILFLLGFIDDRAGVPPVGKLAVQLLGAGLLLWAGLRLTPGWPVWVSVPLTVLWVVGITNAVNLLDNMDGLAAGVSVIAASTIAVIAWLNGHAEVVGGSLVIAAAAGGFLVYNFNPARTFMGDCGSLFLGFALAGLALTIPSTGMGRGVGTLVVVPAAVMAVPILDTTLVTIKRLVVGRRVSQGGRDHASHRLVALGLSERGAVLALYGVAALAGAIAVGVHHLEVAFALSLLIYTAVALGAFGAFLATVRTYDPETEERGRIRASGRGTSDHAILRTALQNRRTVVGIAVDLCLVAASFLAAFYLRYDGVLPPFAADTLSTGLPLVVAVKLTVFHFFGLYRGLWRFAGTPEILRTVVGSVVGSVVATAVLVLAFGAGEVPGSVLAMDAVLATTALVGVRSGFRGFRGLFANVGAAGATRRVLIYGAGRTGTFALRELREKPDWGMTPVGFLDDDPEKHGRFLLGLPVLGAGGDAKQVADEIGAETVLVAVSDEAEEGMEDSVDPLHAQGLEVFRISVSIVPVAETERSPPES